MLDLWTKHYDFFAKTMAKIFIFDTSILYLGGILCSGILDKSQYGATAYSLTHLLFELYGDRAPCDFLSGISVLFTFFLQVDR